MLYKCISLTQEVVPASAAVNAGEVYFQAQFVPKTDLVNTKLIKVNLFPTSDPQRAQYAELIANSKVLADQQYVKVNVAMPDFRMKDDKTGAWRPKIYSDMDVYVRLIENDEWFQGSDLPKMVREHEPKRLAERTIERLGEFLVKHTHEGAAFVEPAAVVADAAPVATDVVAPVVTAPAMPS